ncbi:MAG: hypothetical protein GTO53_05755 [Planctomycetales bacterium]|nr:hypothetical protein [Planctomycetales bacterium]NIM08649.1 hypothetical protein [Planctomycetales bacterium]NIN08119.1 hypothetical protein [Planctomycetales bacterium]NIN77244.1 hypothetical protein [Planctomycetales bacterium]NIO34433.1 hypothetical protein [Planctomycetales bacterium]
MTDILREPHENQRQPAEYQFAEMRRDGGPQVAVFSKPPANQDSTSLQHTAAPLPPPAARFPHSLPQPDRQGQNDQRIATAALNALLERLDKSHQRWRAEAEREVVQLAFALAERIVRRELERETDIPLDLLQEALELAGRGTRLRVAMHPTDLRVHQDEIRRLTATMRPTAEVEVVGDQHVERGGCIVETPDGLIDQSATAQLRRIREELQA